MYLLSNFTNLKNFSINGFGKIIVLLLIFSLLGGCSKPDEKQFAQEVVDSYECKGMEVVNFERYEDMPGIFSYIGRFYFDYRFVEGEEGAKKFYRELFGVMDMSKGDWTTWMEQEKVQEFLQDDCTESGQLALTRMADMILPQMQEGAQEIKVPVSLPLSDWAEMMMARKGWVITNLRSKQREDKEPVFSAPISRDVLLKKPSAVTKNAKKKSKIIRWKGSK